MKFRNPFSRKPSGSAFSLLLLAGVCLLFPAASRAENCPWLNAATAGGLLGGEVTAEVTHPAMSDVTCKFVLKDSSVHAKLEIVVHTMATVGDEFPQILAECGPASTPIRAIGNEAVGCTKSDAPDMMTEEIVSRVRDRSFILRWTMPKPQASSQPESKPAGEAASPAEDEIKDKVQNVGQQVAGSLF